MRKIRIILTAIGNPILNNELKKIEDFKIINNDVQYQDGIFEILEINSEINFIILNPLISGNLNIEELIEKIQNINSKIKIILILEEYDENLEKVLMKQGVYRIFYNNKIEIKDIIKIIDEDDKMEIYNREIRMEIEKLKEYIINNKNNQKINFEENNYEKNNSKNYLLEKHEEEINEINNCKIISILGNNGSGKSTFSVMLANTLKKKNKKILILDFDILNNSLHTILGVNKYPEKIKKILENNNLKNKINIENLIIKINKKIDLISGINLIFDSKQKISEEKIKEIINKLSKLYNYIIIDTTSECFFEYTKEIIKNSDESFFLTEANILEISKSKRFLELYSNNWNIEKNKIKIIFNKTNRSSIDMELLKKIYSDYQIFGKIKLKTNYIEIINNKINKINKINMLNKVKEKYKKTENYNFSESKIFRRKMYEYFR